MLLCRLDHNSNHILNLSNGAGLQVSMASTSKSTTSAFPFLPRKKHDYSHHLYLISLILV
jgi:hypothetical protein